jgi:hypothetical protein|tara:strand:+ start:1189 stop:1533 length:345 start_codon:yes stop_codon:yes gene_type:complete
MSTFTANASVEGVKQSGSADVNIGNTLEEAIEIYGEPCVWDLYKRGATLAVQQRIGGHLRAGTDPKDVGKAMADFRLDQRATRSKKSVEDKVTDLFEGLSKEQIAQVLSNAGLK